MDAAEWEAQQQAHDHPAHGSGFATEGRVERARWVSAQAGGLPNGSDKPAGASKRPQRGHVSTGGLHGK